METERQPGGRFSSLDGIRGILALSIAAFHLEVAQHDFGLPSWYGAVPASIARAIVWIFFVLSAYVLVRAWGRAGYLTFLLKRLLRLWPTFAFCVAGCALLLWYRLNPLLLTFVPLECPPDVPAWSLSYEARAMIFMPALVWASRGGVIRPLCLAALALADLGLAILPLGSAVAFILGAWLSRYDAPRIWIFEAWPCQWLGRISYSLYLSQWPILGLLTTHLGLWAVPVSLPAVLLVAWCVWWLVERPSLAWSHQVQASSTQMSKMFAMWLAKT